jgi:ribonuclease P protein component
VAHTFRARQRIGCRPDFQRVYDLGRRVHGRFMTLVILPNDLDVSRLGIAAPRRLGSAVERNRAKRLVREIFRQRAPREAIDLVVMPRPTFLEADYVELEAEYQSLLQRRRGGPRAGTEPGNRRG